MGSAWGLGNHHALYAGAPLDVRPPAEPSGMISMPNFVSFYRWHVPDPIIFREHLRVTLQQIGMNMWPVGEEAGRDAYVNTNPLAGNGWFKPGPGNASIGLLERVDDVSAAAFVYLTSAQSVPTVDIAAAVADLTRRVYEQADPLESFEM